MKRRAFIKLLGGTAAAWPLSARAQQPERVRRIGVLMSMVESDPRGLELIQPRSDGLQTSLTLPYNRSKALTSGGRVMHMHGVISHGVIGCAGVIAGYVIATGHLAIVPSFAQTPVAGQRSTELFNRVMEDVLGRRLTVRLTERDPGNGSAAHRHPGSHTVGYILEGTYEVKIDEGPVRTLKPGEVFYEAPNALHAVSRNPSSTQPLKYLVIQVSDPTKPATVSE